MYRKPRAQRKHSRDKNLPTIPKKLTWSRVSSATKPNDDVELPVVDQNPLLAATQALPDFSPTDDLLFVGTPENIVKSFAKIPVVNYHFNFKSRPLDIFVTEIHSPYKFWFVLADDSQKLTALMDTIHRFYSEQDYLDYNPYQMTEVHAVEGRPCVTLYNFIWHRAVIVKFIDADEVTVFYFDYGTIGTIPLDSIRFLLKEFAFELPKVIMRGRLALVAPNGTHWKREALRGQFATEAFFDLVFSKKMKATLYAYEEDEHIYHLILHDASLAEGHQMCSINQKLALADQCQLLTRRIEQWPYEDELYPTFEMLEKNEYPTYVQLCESKDPDSFLSEEKTAAYYADEYKRKKFQSRIVYGYIGDSFNESFIKLEKKVKSGLTSESLFDPPPTYVS